MVEYTEWTSIGYAVARQKGARLEGPNTQDENRELVSLLAEIWNDRKGQLENATKPEARKIAQQEIAVS